VRAKTDVVVLEVLRNVLYILQRNKMTKAMLDDVYRRRSIEGQLRSVPMFSGLLRDEARFKEFLNDFRERMTLVRLNPGEVIFKQGDTADNFYLVKGGFVKVSQRHPGGEHVLSYVGPGGYIGEIGLLWEIPEIAAVAPPGRRVATCSALDHVDLVKITGTAFQEIITKYPEVREQLVQVALQRLRENEESRQRVEQTAMGEFVRQGLMNAQSLLVLDLTKCTRCDECTKACSDAHEGVTRLIREGLRFENFLVASSCRACLDPYCMVGCPVDAIHRKPTREMVIEDWCIGCGTCAKNCPYGNINMHPFPMLERKPDAHDPGKWIEVPVMEEGTSNKPVFREKATMCDLCSELDGNPSCVYACPHDAAHRYSGDEFRKIVEKRRR
jgi:Fe-S-cluster-containing hydrogenase component 2/CRP-like cAMP-binding protein